MPNYNKNYYKQKIAKHEVEQLMEALLQDLSQYLTLAKESPLQNTYDQLIILSGKLKGIQQEKALNIADPKLADIEESRINQSLLRLINGLPQRFFDFLNGDRKVLPQTSPDLRQQITDIHKQSKYEYDVFLSFSSQDLAEAKTVCEELRGYGLSVFLSDEALKANTGSSFFEKIEHALHHSQHFVLLSSPNSMGSEWVKIEYETFFNEYHLKSKRERRFIVLKSRAFALDLVPRLLRRLQFAGSAKDILETFVKDKAFQERKRRKAEEKAKEKAKAEEAARKAEEARQLRLLEEKRRAEQEELQRQALEERRKREEEKQRQKALEDKRKQEEVDRLKREEKARIAKEGERERLALERQKRLEQKRRIKAAEKEVAKDEKRRKKAAQNVAWVAFFNKNGKRIVAVPLGLILILVIINIVPYLGNSGGNTNDALAASDSLEQETPLLIDSLKAQKEAEKRYQTLLSEANNLYNKKDYEDAKTKYQAAIDAAQDETIDVSEAEQGIKECNSVLSKIAEEEADKEKRANYNKYKKRGDTHFGNREYQEAKNDYIKAKSYLATSEINSKIADCEEKLKPKPTALSPIIVALENNMKTIPSGTFTMGCTSEQGSDCDDDEKPVHQVTLSSFKINKYEVTQEEWRAVMGEDPTELKFKGCDKCPVESVNRLYVLDFLRKLNQLTGKDYRLPTEAEWEYAARGGDNYKYAGSNNIDEVAWYSANSGSKTHPVGGKKANSYGLYDMSGNVYEWCGDSFRYYSSEAQTNPKGNSLIGWTIRSGSYNHDAWYCRVASHDYLPQPHRRYYLGFRLAHR